jgi:exodeoxyribonuclease-1
VGLRLAAQEGRRAPRSAGRAKLFYAPGRYPAERGCLAVVQPLAPHPKFKNEVIVWDLAVIRRAER